MCDGRLCVLCPQLTSTIAIQFVSLWRPRIYCTAVNYTLHYASKKEPSPRSACLYVQLPHPTRHLISERQDPDLLNALVTTSTAPFLDFALLASRAWPRSLWNVLTCTLREFREAVDKQFLLDDERPSVTVVWSRLGRRRILTTEAFGLDGFLRSFIMICRALFGRVLCWRLQ